MEPSRLNNIDQQRFGVTPFNAPELSFSREETLGNLKTEIESAKFFDEIMAAHQNLFRVQKEVTGHYVQPRFLAANVVDEDGRVKRPRIDRIILPQRDLIEAGWRHGPFGVELKKSGEKVGPPLSQILDYTRAVWFLKDEKGIRNGYNIMLDWCFLWPWDCGHGNVESIAIQNRIGGAYFDHYYRFVLKTGGCKPLTISNTGEVNAKTIASGNKVGSR